MDPAIGFSIHFSTSQRIPASIGLDSKPYSLVVHYDSSSDSYIIDSASIKEFYDDRSYEIRTLTILGEDSLEEFSSCSDYELLSNDTLKEGEFYALIVILSSSECIYYPGNWSFAPGFTYIDGTVNYDNGSENEVVSYPLSLQVWDYTPKAEFLSDPEHYVQFFTDCYETFSFKIEWEDGTSDLFTRENSPGYEELVSELHEDWDVYRAPDEDKWRAWYGFDNLNGCGYQSLPFEIVVNDDFDPLSQYIGGIKQ